MRAHSPTIRRFAAAATAVVLGAVGATLVAAPAHAAGASVFLDDGVIYFKAAPGQTNKVNISKFPGGDYLIDDVVPLVVGDGCAAVPNDNTVAFCPEQTRPIFYIIELGDGNDTIRMWDIGEAWIHGSTGNDTITAGPTDPREPLAANELYGGEGDDTIRGGPSRDLINGEGGADNIDGGEGDDSISGDEGDDHIVGGGGNDYVDARVFEPGQNPGNDILEGGTGNDTLFSGTGRDVLSGGPGTDIVSYLGRDERVFADLDGATLDDGATNEQDTIRADVENLQGGDGDDILTGNNDPNAMNGGKGTDILIGQGGNDGLDGAAGTDTLFGGDGDDRMYGSYDADNMYGGAGADVLHGGPGYDLISGGTEIDQCLPEQDGALLDSTCD